MSNLTAKQRAVLMESQRRGVALLDANLPNWWTEEVIDLETLDLNACDTCILGQAAMTLGYFCGEYVKSGLELGCALGVDGYDASYGFEYDDSLDADNRLQYEYLDTLWAETILERRAPGELRWMTVTP